MLKKIIETLSIPLLYYTDKTGYAVFRNFCFLKNTGCMYNTAFPKQNIGKALEFRFALDKRLKWLTFLTPIILYFIFIHLSFSIFKLLFFELLWLGIVFGTRFYFSYIYSRYLIKHFGQYELCEFTPPVPKHKIAEYVSVYKANITVILIILGLYFIPALFLQLTIKMTLSPKHLHCKSALVLSNIYNVPAVAVDTHVSRVANRLGLTDSNDVSKIERDLMHFFPEDKWSRVHHQLVLFGRYICKSKGPLCEDCPFYKCEYKQIEEK